MPKQTVKWVETVKKAAQVLQLTKSQCEKKGHKLYELMAEAGYWWDSASQVWHQGAPPTMQSVGRGEQAKGIRDVRIVCHADEWEEAVKEEKILRDMLGQKILSISEPYPSRKKQGGVLIYLQVLVSQ